MQWWSPGNPREAPYFLSVVLNCDWLREFGSQSMQLYGKICATSCRTSLTAESNQCNNRIITVRFMKGFCLSVVNLLLIFLLFMRTEVIECYLAVHITHRFTKWWTACWSIECRLHSVSLLTSANIPTTSIPLRNQWVSFMRIYRKISYISLVMCLECY